MYNPEFPIWPICLEVKGAKPNKTSVKSSGQLNIQFGSFSLNQLVCKVILYFLFHTPGLSSVGNSADPGVVY